MQVILQSLLAPLFFFSQLFYASSVTQRTPVSLSESGISVSGTSIRHLHHHLRHHHHKREPKKDHECHHLIFCNNYATERKVSVFWAPYFGRHGDKFKEKLVEKVPYGECQMSVTMHETKMQVNNFDRGSLWFEDENADQPKVPGNLKVAFAKYDIGHEPEPHWIVVFLVRTRVLDFRAKVLVQHVPKRVLKDYVPLLFRNSYHGVAEHSMMVRNKNKQQIPLKHTAFAMPPGDGDTWEAYEGTERAVQKFPADEGDMIIVMLIGNEPQQPYAGHFYDFHLIAWSLKQGMLTHMSTKCRMGADGCGEGKCMGVNCGDHGDCNPDNGKCVCDPGWEGDYCANKITAPPTPAPAPAPGAPAPPPTTTTTEPPPPTPPPFCVDGDDTCGDHGTCVDGECVCDDGWTGQYCDIKIHNPNATNVTKEDMPFPDFGKEPPEAVPGKEPEKEESEDIPAMPFQDMYKDSNPPPAVEKEEEEYVPLPFPDFSDEDIQEQNASSSPWAPVPYNSSSKEPLPQDVPEQMEVKECGEECKPHGQCGPAGECICEPEWSGETCDDRVVPQELDPPVNPVPAGQSSKCAGKTCSGHGICRESDGLCDCDPGWTGPDCSIRQMEPYEQRSSDGAVTEDWTDETSPKRYADPAPGDVSHEKPVSEEPFEWQFPWWLLVLLVLLCCCCAVAAGSRS